MSTSINSANINMSKYLHTYEAFRIPKDSRLNKSHDSETAGAEEKEDQLVLTDKARKQLIQDRIDYGAAMMEKQRKLHAEERQEALEKYAQDQAKMLEVFRSMSKGNMVSDTDEKKLMDYDPKLYMAAKMAQMLAQRVEKEKEKHFDEKEEQEYEKKMQAYNKKADEMNESWNSDFDNFLSQQKASVVEVDASGIDFSSIKSIVSLGGGLKGAVVDTAI